MPKFQNSYIQDDVQFKKIAEPYLRNGRLFIIGVITALSLAFLVNRYSIPIYNISSSILIKDDKNQQPQGKDINNFINSSLFGTNQNFQNELWVFKSTPVIEQTIRNLNLEVTYYKKSGLRYNDAYRNVPFHIDYMAKHPQPVNVRFEIIFTSESSYVIKAKSKIATIYDFDKEKVILTKEKWEFIKSGNLGKLIETDDLEFIVSADSTNDVTARTGSVYGFEFRTVNSLSSQLKGVLKYSLVDKLATVIEIKMRSESLKKGTDVINELMNVYSEQNLARKNHVASITIDYIEKQLNEISDSLSITEDNLQSFRSSNQLLNITDQAAGISTQYMNLQNQLAEMVTHQKYYEYISDYLKKNSNFSDIVVPASYGIQDPLINSLIGELLSAQAQRSNLIENQQERNPLVQRLGIQIENVKKTISETIEAASKTTAISIEEMNKRISKTEAQISKLPVTQRKLGNIERKYHLNDAIYNYLLEKRAEAKITKASNLPDDIIIEPAKMIGMKPVSPNKMVNYIIALFLGMSIPFGFIFIKTELNEKIESQEDIERITKFPLLGKIPANNFKVRNIMYEHPNSNISESFRALRTNLDFYAKGLQKKVIMVTSCMESEGKTFIAENLAMSYAQLGRKTILVNFDLRKAETYFNHTESPYEGLSTYLIGKIKLENIIKKSPHNNLDYIPSGILPPNPAELLGLDSTERLISGLKQKYEIIVLDTTPLAQVTDAYLLINLADLKLVLTRQNYTLKKVLLATIKDIQQKEVENVCIVLNGNKIIDSQYGYGYGYHNNGKSGKRAAKVKV